MSLSPVPVASQTVDGIYYPETDGLPMAENTLQFEWIVTIKCGLEAVFKDDPNVFVAGDLLWYPVEGDPGTCVAPDTMVVFGRPKGHRSSYLQWKEGGIAPQVVFEVLSPGNSASEMLEKGSHYSRLGVEEYYIYDPDRNLLYGHERVGDALREIPLMSGWTSPRLHVRFRLVEGTLQLFDPDGNAFATYVELVTQRNEARAERNEALDRNRRLAERLRALGVDPDSV
jgi:Uma2 family endonuclease